MKKISILDDVSTDFFKTKFECITVTDYEPVVKIEPDPDSVNLMNPE
jgi:hypothetical protein